MCLSLLSSVACSQKDAGSRSSPAGSASEPTPGSAAVTVAAADAAPAPPADSGSATDTSADSAGEVAQLVVHDVGSKALGSQQIEASCVSVLVMPAGKWTVATARLKDCGDKTARSILWIYKRAGNTKWSEDYVGQPPRCWKGVPPDIAEAVIKATKIPSC